MLHGALTFSYNNLKLKGLPDQALKKRVIWRFPKKYSLQEFLQRV